MRDLKTLLVKELKMEGDKTRKMLATIPFEHFGWKPHEKSMLLGRIATHLVELPTWVGYTLNSDGIDFATMNYTPPVVNSIDELLELFDVNQNEAVAVMEAIDPIVFEEPWTMRNGEHIYFTQPKIDVLRDFTFNHSYHHRGQLSVYLRLLNVPLVGVYGPTADDKMGM